MKNISEQLRTYLCNEELMELLQNCLNDKDNLTPELVDSLINKFNKMRRYIEITSSCGIKFDKFKEQFDVDCKTKIPILSEFKGADGVSFDLHDADDAPVNFLIEGDNLHALNLLKKTHIKNGQGTIDVIYIDPPYNTGNDGFVYKDGWQHSEWLSFMERRLKIAKELMANDGVIFISIDDREFANLKLLCDSVFGEENFVTMFIWKKNNDNVRKNVKKILVMNEYVLCYQKSHMFKGLFDKKTVPTTMSNPDNDPRGDWFSANISNPVENENSKNVYEVGINGHKVKRRWFENKEVIERYIAENKIYLPVKKNGEIGVPRLKKFIEDFDDVKIANNFLMDWSTSDGQDDLKAVFQDTPFSYPKPVELIKRLIGMYNKQDITVLDFFAGSGTTGQAVLELNKADGPNGKRKFILCTNNEVHTTVRNEYLINNGYMPQQPKGTKELNVWKAQLADFLSSPEFEKIEASDDYQAIGICRSVTYQRLAIIINGVRKDGSEYPNQIDANLKYLKCDFIDKDLSRAEKASEFCKNIKSMLQLEYSDTYIPSDTDFIAFGQEDLAVLENNPDQLAKVERLYCPTSIVVSGKIERLIKNGRNKDAYIERIDIPERYFKEDCKDGL